MRGLTNHDDEPTTSLFSRVQSLFAQLFQSSRASSSHDEEHLTSPTAQDNQSQPGSPYAPQHAAQSFLRTATPYNMRAANEVL
ncbi:Uu.00g029350.m01.CDS01 [Anthostomella pinea]|uniref:Uu.00g029350.m01.CDS01 n=1 Tax=Anthostomella pinea TaxID=933095 RepID=A0AAI8V8P5_9PEZI|nr:Uu.00g029350.m01.CDS01 [Anthostomella pinea]